MVDLAARHPFARALVNTGRMSVANAYPTAAHLPEGCQRVPAGRVFLASHTRNSIDSRYFGAVAVQTLTAHAVPLWTWR